MSTLEEISTSTLAQKQDQPEPITTAAVKIFYIKAGVLRGSRKQNFNVIPKNEGKS